MEFYLLVQHLGLIEMGLISPRRVIEAFLWSRIRCARTTRTKKRLACHHSFEDFLEAFVRMALWRCRHYRKSKTQVPPTGATFF